MLSNVDKANIEGLVHVEFFISNQINAQLKTRLHLEKIQDAGERAMIKQLARAYTKPDGYFI
ncbi:MAG TPA: hypothetical protein DEO56_01595 [Nitrosomonas nitrosa]|nr:hypothetical protein [Nitrosomonas nitrosa]HNP51766.1 hypothetical protein [Nitrosomonas nitrosa]